MPHIPADAMKINVDSEQNWAITCKYEISCLPTVVEVDEHGEVVLRLDRPMPRDLARYIE
jgi:hypothetical protein